MAEVQEQARFEGWAIVEVLGHRTMAGYAKTVYFGPNAMIHVTQPDVPVQERVLDRDQYVNGELCAAGSKIRISREKAEAFIGAGSIYQLTPCTEAAALARQPETIEIVEKIARKLIMAAAIESDNSFDDDEDGEEL